MFEDISDTLKATLYERVSSPFISSFILSWCVFNYKILFILFSDMEVRYKFYEIELLQMQPQNLITMPVVGWQFYPCTFLYPLLIAFFYTLVFPFFEAKLFSVWLKGQKAIKSIKVTIEDETPVSQEKYTSLLKQLRHMSREYADDLARKDDSCKVDLQIERDKTIEKQSEINSLDNKYEIYKEETDTTINDLQLEIERLHEELSELRESKQADLKPTPTSIEYAVLTSLVNAPSFTQADSTLLANYLGSSKLMAEDVIQEIINKGYCSERQTANSRLITITAIGKKYYKLLSTGTR